MPSVKRMILESPRPAPETFAALLQVAQRDPYEVVGVSNEQHEMMFKRGKTALSWGHLFAATVVAQVSGSVLQLSVTVVPGAPRALLDGRKNQKAGEQLVAAVEEVLAQPGQPSPEPVESFATLDDGTRVPWTEGDYPGEE